MAPVFDEVELQTLFARWWADEYRSIPGARARQTHAAFGKWLLERGAAELLSRDPEPA